MHLSPRLLRAICTPGCSPLLHALAPIAQADPAGLLEETAIETLSWLLEEGVDPSLVVEMASGHEAAAEAVRRAEKIAAEARRLRALERFVPAPTKGRDETIREQVEVITTWVREAAAYAAKNGARDIRRSRKDHADALAALRAAQDEAGMDAALEGILDAGKTRAPAIAPRLLITGAQGTGKSTALIEGLASLHAPGLIVWFLVPTHERAEETVKEYEARRRVLGGTLPSLPIRGRTAVSRTNKKARMCERWEVVAEAQREGVSDVEAQICKVCPLRESCEYLAQRTQALGMIQTGGVFVLPHDYIYLPSFVPAPGIVAIDEAVKNLVGVEEVDPAFLTAIPPEVLTSNEGPEILATLGALASALLTGGNDGGRAAVRAALSKGDLAATARVLGQHEDPPDVSAHADDDQALRACLAKGAAKRSWARAAKRIVKAVIREWDVPSTPAHPDGRPGFRAVWIAERDGQTRICAARLKRHHVAQDRPVLWLDGTGDVGLCGRVLPGLKHRDFPIDRQGMVYQTVGRKFSRAFMIARRVGRMTAKPISPEKDLRAGKHRQAIRAYADAVPGTFVASSKATIEALRAEGLQSKSGHFNALRGLNTFKACRRAVIVGCDNPQPDKIEPVARGYSALDPEPFASVSRYVPVQRWRRMRDGRLVSVEVETHPDPLCDAVLYQFREAEVLQAMDRVRAIFQERTIILLNELALPVAIDKEASAKDLLERGSRAAGREERANGMGRLMDLLPAAKAVPLTREALCRLWPGVWSSQAQARAWIEQQGGPEAIAARAADYCQDAVTMSLSNPTLTIFRPVAFRAEGARGASSWALVRADLDPAEALAEVMGRSVQIDGAKQAAAPMQAAG
jgi:hypothetical protein